MFPKSCAQSLKNKYKGTDRRSLVSPVHFWFFVSCYMVYPNRPLYPETPDTLFRHPLFFIKNHAEHHQLVVPEYFFDDNASFGGLTNLDSTSYYIFPFFGKKLFEYVVTQPKKSFAAYYFSCEFPWFVPRGSDATSKFIKPHPTVRRHWRWEEVLEMLWSQKESLEGRRPKWRQSPPDGYGNDLRINNYLNHFAKVAEAWVRRRRGSTPRSMPSDRFVGAVA